MKVATPFTRNRVDFDAAGRYWDRLTATSADQSLLQHRQLQLLQQVWDDCVVDVPYYRRLVNQGDAPKHIRSWDDLRHVPILNRVTLQSCPEEFQRLSGPSDAYRETGGSTGQPIRIGIWNDEVHIQRIVKLVLWSRAGYTPGDRLFLIWGHLHLLGVGWRRRVNSVKRSIADRLLGYRRVNAYKLSAETCESMAKSLIQFKPAGLIGYANALDYFVRSTEKYHDQFRDLGLRFVMPASEVAPRPDTYATLSDVFGCPVVQEFGGVEFGQIAMQFDSGPFEVFPDVNYLEASQATESREAGRVLLTSLHRRYVPLIRYEQGDVITDPVTLANGHVHAFAAIKGRTHDLVELSDGSVVHSMAVLHCIHQERSVIHIQLTLTDSGPVLTLSSTHNGDETCERRIRSRLSEVSPLLSAAPIVWASDVKTTVSGKRRWLIDERTNKSP